MNSLAALKEPKKPERLRKAVAPKSKAKLAPNDKTKSITDLFPVSEPTFNVKVSKKHLSLQNPRNKTSAYRAELKKTKKTEQEKLHKAKIRGYRVRGLIDRQERKLGNSLTWETANGLRAIWLGYIAEVLGLELDLTSLVSPAPTTAGTGDAVPNDAGDVEEDGEKRVDRYHASQQGFSPSQVQSWHSKLVKADYHGAFIRVKSSTNVSIVGKSGIIVQETEGTWSIVTQKNVIKVLPKPGAIFTLTLPLANKPGQPKRELNFDLSGTSFAHKDRVGRKWKAAAGMADFGPDGGAVYF